MLRGWQRERDRYVRKSHREHEGHTQLLGPGELKLGCLVDRKSDDDDVHDEVDDTISQDELVDVKTAAGFLCSPTRPGEVDFTSALEDYDEDEENRDEDVETDDRVCNATEDGRCVEDPYEEEANRQLRGRDVYDVEHLIGKEGHQDPGDVGEGNLPCVLAEP